MPRDGDHHNHQNDDGSTLWHTSTDNHTRATRTSQSEGGRSTTRSPRARHADQQQQQQPRGAGVGRDREPESAFGGATAAKPQGAAHGHATARRPAPHAARDTSTSDEQQQLRRTHRLARLETMSAVTGRRPPPAPNRRRLDAAAHPHRQTDTHNTTSSVRRRVLLTNEHQRRATTTLWNAPTRGQRGQCSEREEHRGAVSGPRTPNTKEKRGIGHHENECWRRMCQIGGVLRTAAPLCAPWRRISSVVRRVEEQRGRDAGARLWASPPAPGMPPRRRRILMNP